MITEELDKLNTIVTCYGGSHAYGTNIATSDIDIRGIFCADEKAIRTPFHTVREVNMDDEEDGKLYELNNFMKLYVDMNPNILELLWVDDKSIITSSEAYNHLRSYRDQLLSTKAAFTFTGYAMQQMKRIKGHNKWINNPQADDAPVAMNFMKHVQNLTDGKVISRDFNISAYRYSHILVPYGGNIFGMVRVVHDMNIVAGLFNRNGSIRNMYEDLPNEIKKCKPDHIVKFCEDEYKNAKNTWKNYHKWKRERNPVRHAMEEEFGYDTKHAMHIVRLMRMGEEILTTGKVNVFREDAQELLDVRNGKWTYEELLSWAEEKDNLVRNVLYKQSDLPKQVDLNLASKVLIEVQDICWPKG